MALVTLQEAKLRHARYYCELAQTSRDDLARMTLELPQFRYSLAWLMQQSDHTCSRLLLDFIRVLASYLLGISYNEDLLNYCDAAITACDRLNENSGWLRLLKAQSYFDLSNWNQALTEAKTAKTISEVAEPTSYAQALLMIGQIQLNQGKYRSALAILSEAENWLSKLDSVEGTASAKKEVAAYFLNRREYARALQLYVEVDQLEQQKLSSGRSAHTLFMLGVTYRKIGELDKSAEYLDRLLWEGKEQNSRSTIATAQHHLAWIKLDQKRLQCARRLAEQAQKVYLEIADRRGFADVEEQLGAICIEEGNIEDAISHLVTSVNIRRQIGNRHGVASSLRRLALANRMRGSYFRAVYFLSRSICLYFRLGMLSHQRIVSFFDRGY